MTNNNENLVKILKDEQIEFVDLIFSDMFGMLHHFTVPASRVDNSFLTKGLFFDGSSIRAWQSIEKSDMTLKPDCSSFFRDPFRKHSTICIYCDIEDPRTNAPYEKDPRSILQKAISYMKELGIGDTMFFGPEPEFFVFDTARYSSERYTAFYQIDSLEAPWSASYENSLGHKMDYKGGYTPMSPIDTLTDFRNDVVKHLEQMGLSSELHHHEVATAGQCEINIPFAKALYSADNVNTLKYAIKNTAQEYGKTATFMPKPIFQDNGSGMHTHVSIWKGKTNTFSGDGYSNLSQTAMYAIGGLLKNGRAIQTFTNPTANSFRRLVPGYEAPVTLAYSSANRSSAIRIPFANSDAARRIEFRCPDSSGSSYLAYAAIAMACIDGIKNKIDPGDPLDKNLYKLSKEELANYRSTCTTQEEAFDHLRKNKDWLTANDVFTSELLDSYLTYRIENEVEPLKHRPNPYEYLLYYAI